MTQMGWEPVTFIAPNAQIVAVCFRKPAVPKPAPIKAPAPAPAGPPLGRCTAAEVSDMRSNGMSESAINSACKAP
jgi:hypothetical protein